MKTKSGNKIVQRFTFRDGYSFDYAIRQKDSFKLIEKFSHCPYRLVYLNKDKLQILTYCEGDTSTITAETRDQLALELKEAKRFYKKYSL